LKNGREEEVNNSTPDTNLFSKKTLNAAPKIFKSHRPQVQKPRKKRKDAKNDIKFKLSVEDKKLLKLKAIDHRMPLTRFASFVVKKDLVLDKEYDDYEYEKDGEFVHVELQEDYFEMLKYLAAEWNLSYRMSAHRIIKEYLNREYNDVSINEWRHVT
jgi:hypothetical protein